jgi:SAM-dependent methyltransferase
MSFAVPAEAYDRFMGRHARLLAPRFVEFAGVQGGPVLDLGCGSGALTETLARRLGPEAVAAVEPSPSFAEACRRTVPGADVRVGKAESLPFADRTFAAVLSQLVFSFIPDAPRALGEAVRVSRAGGVVAACMWHARGMEMLDVFWQGVLRVDPAAPDESGMRFRREGELLALWESAGLRQVHEEAIDVTISFPGFDAWWEPFALGVGPAGAYLAAQPPERRELVREACRRVLGDPRGSFSQQARAIAVRGTRAA